MNSLSQNRGVRQRTIAKTSIPTTQCGKLQANPLCSCQTSDFNTYTSQSPTRQLNGTKQLLHMTNFRTDPMAKPGEPLYVHLTQQSPPFANPNQPFPSMKISIAYTFRQSGKKVLKRPIPHLNCSARFNFRHFLDRPVGYEPTWSQRYQARKEILELCYFED